MQADTLVDAPSDNVITPFVRYLGSENDVLRSAAMRALPALGTSGLNAVRSTLLSSLMDPDPDVRCDAMEILALVALPEDAEIIRRSLEGDPVREVKLATISTLARLKDVGSIDIIQSLATSRSEDRVAWEDEHSDWEDWLDIQTAAIKALGELGADNAIETLRSALNDEFGQTVDGPVYGALSQMGSAGVAMLLDIFREANGVSRRRAAEALSRVSPDSLAAHLEALLQAEEPEIRILALTVMSAEDPRCEVMAKSDVDSSVRCRALRHAVSAFPELARQCLSDVNELVQAAAVECLKPPYDKAFQEILVDNFLVWLDRAKPILAMLAARKLSELAPERAEAPLLECIDNLDRPLEIRVAAVKALDAAEMSVASAVLVERLENAAHQVRAAVLTVLCRRAIEKDEVALEAAVEAIAGRLVAPSEASDEESIDLNAMDFGTPKEGSGPRKIWITPKGDIVDRDQMSEEPQQGSSTLDSILSDPEAAKVLPMAEDTPEESSGKRAKRRAVEGSGDFAKLLTCDATLIFSDVDDARITEALISRIADRDEMIRRMVWNALSSSSVPDDFISVAEAAFRDTDPVIRLAAFRILSEQFAVDLIAEALIDADALMRAEAVATLSGDVLLDYLGDKASVVRDTAVKRIAESGDNGLILFAVDGAVKAERVDTLSSIVRLSATAKARAVQALADEAVSDRSALVILRGLETDNTLHFQRRLA